MSAVQEWGVVSEDLITSVKEGDAVEVDDLCLTGRGRRCKLARPHSVKIGHDCKFRYNSRR